MLNKFKILVIILLGIFILSPLVSAGVIDNIPAWDIKDVSIKYNSSWNIVDDVNNVWLSLLTTTKLLLQWVLIIFIVIVWAQMIMAMWSDEEKLTNSKRQLWYTLVAIIFINIPWTIYNMFHNDDQGKIWKTWANSWRDDWESGNIFIDSFSFWTTLNDQIIWFLEVIIFAAAVFMIMLAWIRIMTARWKEEAISEWKNKIIYSVIAVILVGFIEMWKYVAFEWNISDWVDFFSTLANLALFFAWPVAIFFLSFAWYYFVTSNGDEERIKKAKTIVINTVIATLILLASYTFLLDLASL